MCVTSRLATSPLDRAWQVLLISLRLPRISLTHTLLPTSPSQETEAWKSERKSAGDASGLLFNLAATQQSGTHLSPTLKVILNRLTQIHVSSTCDIDESYTTAAELPWTFKKGISSLFVGKKVQRIDRAWWDKNERVERLQCCYSPVNQGSAATWWH